MTSETNHSAIGSLVLVRLLAAGEKGESNTKIQKDLEPLLAHRWSGVPMAGAVNRAVDELKAAGLVGFLLGKSKRAAAKITLTADGRQRALDILGVAALKPKINWGVLRKTYLPASVLGLPASTDARFKAMASEPVFRAVLLKQQYDLPTAEIPKLDDAIDALAWKLIGFEGETRKFTVTNVKTAVLNRELGDGRATDLKKAASRLVARGAGARRDDPKELRDAVLRDWIDRYTAPPLVGGDARGAEDGASSHSTPTLPFGAPSPIEEEGLAAFAGRVKAAARDCPTGRYGDNKVFIAHVWRMLRSDPDFAGIGLDTFKDRLGEANNARLLDLGRADLIQAMDPDDVRLSELQYLNATFHFVRI
jgi:hypothetical protein